jgi:hypothetical protein
MRKLALLLLAIAALPMLGGCSASDMSGDAASSVGGSGGDYYGGQTGSLVPLCGLAPLSDEGQSVPAGEQAFVVYTQGCPAPLDVQDIVVSDANGDPVDVEVQALGSGAFLVKGAAMLEEGQYQVSLPSTAAARAINVGPTQDLPIQLGELQLRDTRCDYTDFALVVDPELLSYLPLTRFSISVDGRAPYVWRQYGEVSLQDGAAELRLEHCNTGGCLTNGSHNLTVYADIAGEAVQPDLTSLGFQITCASSLAAGTDSVADDSGTGCALSRPARPRATLSLLWVLGVSLLLGRRARGRSRMRVNE